MAKAGHKGMGVKAGVEHVGETRPDAFDQDDIASEIRGKHSLQSSSHNERQTVADEKRGTEGLIESFENLDPIVRAEREKAGASGS